MPTRAISSRSGGRRSRKAPSCSQIARACGRMPASSSASVVGFVAVVMVVVSLVMRNDWRRAQRERPVGQGLGIAQLVSRVLGLALIGGELLDNISKGAERDQDTADLALGLRV